MPTNHSEEPPKREVNLSPEDVALEKVVKAKATEALSAHIEDVGNVEAQKIIQNLEADQKLECPVEIQKELITKIVTLQEELMMPLSGLPKEDQLAMVSELMGECTPVSTLQTHMEKAKVRVSAKEERNPETQQRVGTKLEQKSELTQVKQEVGQERSETQQKEQKIDTDISELAQKEIILFWWAKKNEKTQPISKISISIILESIFRKLVHIRSLQTLLKITIPSF